MPRNHIDAKPQPHPNRRHKSTKEYVRGHSSIKKRESSQQDQERLWRLHIKLEFAEFEIQKIKHRDIDAFISRKASRFHSDDDTVGRANNVWHNVIHDELS